MSVLFCINVYKNADQAQKLAAKLNALYSWASVCLIDDEADHLKTPDKAGAWTARWLKAFVDALGAPGTCIKIDPDVTPARAYTDLPPADVFGALSIYPKGTVVVRGGVMGVTRAAAQRILASGLLADPKYTASEFSYRSKQGRGPVVSYQDAILSDVVSRLGLSVAEWHEVYAHTHQAPREAASHAFVNELILQPAQPPLVQIQMEKQHVNNA